MNSTDFRPAITVVLVQMQGSTLIAPLFLFVASVALARVGEAPEELRVRFGKPNAIALDSKGFGLGIYHAPGFKEIRVTFVAGKSQLEKYFVEDEKAEHEPIVAALEKENPDEDVYDYASLGIQVGHSEPEGELKFVTHSGKETSFTGPVQIKESGDRREVSVQTQDHVIEIPLYSSKIDRRGLRNEMTCTVTVLDERSEDLDTPIAIVGQREHLDWSDSVDDAHDSFQILVKIATDNEIVFDRSICSVHRQEMELRQVSIAYGLLIFSAAERFCDDHFPYSRDYARGGCVDGGEIKVAAIYICPLCVTACNEYKQSHPDDKN